MVDRPKSAAPLSAPQAAQGELDDSTGGQGGSAEARGMSEPTSTARSPNPSVFEARAPASRSDDGHDEHGGHATPAESLRQLIQDEQQSVWVVVVYAIMVGLLALAVPIAVQSLVNTVAFGALVQPVVVLTLLVLAGLSFEGALLALQARVVESVQERIFVRTAADIAYRLPRARVATFDSRDAPELVNRFFDVVVVQKAGASLLLEGLTVVLQMAIGLLLLAFYHPALLAFDIFLIVALLFVLIGLGRGGTATSVQESQAKYAVAAWLEELARHPVAFKSAGGAELALGRVDALCRQYLARRRDHFRVLFRQIVGALTIYALASSALLGLGGYLVLSRQLTLGQLVAAELVVGAVVAGVAKFGKHLENYYDLLAALGKLSQLAELPLEREAGHSPTQTGHPAELELRDLSVGYTASAPVARDLSIVIAPGQRLALMGDNGAGATALLDTMFALRPASRGALLLDQVPLQELSVGALRAEVALVRDTEIFEGTIAENVSLGRAGLDIDRVRRALAVVGLSQEIARLPNGLETVLASGGAPLSRGQAARLALARALAGRPRLLLVDGVLDRLDARSRALASAAIFDDRAPWTLIVATRREDVRALCNRCLVLDGDAGEEALRRGSASFAAPVGLEVDAERPALAPRERSSS
jgi:putative ABC transport system ATP-binding protein